MIPNYQHCVCLGLPNSSALYDEHGYYLTSRIGYIHNCRALELLFDSFYTSMSILRFGWDLLDNGQGRLVSLIAILHSIFDRRKILVIYQRLFDTSLKIEAYRTGRSLRLFGFVYIYPRTHARRTGRLFSMF